MTVEDRAMKKPEHIASFKIGDCVPEWLLEFSPSAPSAVFGEAKFTVDCHVMLVSAGYFILPDSHRLNNLIKITNSNHITIRCVDVPVSIPCRVMTLGTGGGETIDLGDAP